MRIPTLSQFQRQVGMISKEFDQMGRLQGQSASGKKLLESSDDPSLAFQIKSKEDFLSQLQSYADNGSLAQSRAGLLNTAIQNAANVGTDVQTLIKNAENGTLSDHDRAVLAEKMQGDLSSLLQLANTRDGNGEYIFSGSNSGVPAYQLVNGNYQYQGSGDAMMINIAPSISVLYGENGNTVFGQTYTGNGTFQITSSASNQGGASLSPGSANMANYIPDTYSLQFFTNNDGKLVYEVSGAETGQVIPAPPATLPQDAPVFVPGQTISFNGLTMDVKGQPAAGDSFQIQPSVSQNAFNAISGVIDLLKTPITNQGSYNQAITQAGAAFTQILNQLTNCESQAGTQSVTIDTQLNLNKTMLSDQTIALSGLSDIDIPSVYSLLSQQSLILQATQESYMKMQAVLEKMMQL